MFQLEGIDHVALAVSDTERSAGWYIEVLGFERKHDDVWSGRPIFLAKGATGIALFHAHNGAPLVSSKSDHIGMTHFAFRASHEEFLSAQRSQIARNQFRIPRPRDFVLDLFLGS
jgi:catechol 2,3-dioxygenase-like lactoylglutathione lyase family enzyme